VLIRGVRWRLMGSLLVVITAAIAVGAAVVGPLFLRAGGDSLVRQAVADAPVSKTSFELDSATHSTTLDGLAAEQQSLLRSEHLSGLYGGHMVRTMVAPILVTRVSTHQPYLGALTYRSGICSVLHFSAGGCATGPGDAVVSDRMANRFGIAVGSSITVDDLNHGSPARIRITGVFALPNLQSAYWLGAGASHFSFGQNTGRPLFLPQADDLFVASPAAFALPSAYRRSLTIQSGLRPGVLGIGNASAVRRAVLALQQRAAAVGFEVATGIPALLSGPLHQRKLMGTVVVVAAVQLVLLAIWVLTSALMRSADLRRAELRIARLRGFPLPTLVAVSIAEPVALCAVGVVVGIGGAWVAVHGAASILFTHGTVVRPDAWTFVGFGAVLVTIGAVLGVSTIRLLRGSGLVVSSPQSASTRSRVVIDVSILAVSGVALIGASTSGALSSHSNPVAAAAPAVVALGTSVIAVRMVEHVCRRLSAATHDCTAVASFLAVRRIGRRPMALREGRTLVIAVGLACFAVCAWSVARVNRLTDARFSTGARTVVTVTANNLQLTQAVHAVDPRGRFAMAAVEVNSSSTLLMGVDATRLPAVADWPGGTTRPSVSAVSRALTPKTVADAIVTNGAVTISADVSASGAATRVLAHLDLEAWLFDPAHGSRTVDYGRLHLGRFTYQGAPQTGCPCSLIGIGVIPSTKRVPRSGQIHLGLAALSYRAGSGAPRSAGAELTPAAWRSTLAGVRVTANPAGVGVDIPMSAVAGDVGPYAEGAAASLVGPPSVLPAVVGSQTEEVSEGTLAEQGLDGNTITVRPVITATALPRLGANGVFVDLGTLQRSQVRPTFLQASEQVWLGPGAPADAVRRLRAVGLHIDAIQRSSALISQARHTGPALAYDFMLLATIVALLVAAVGTFSVLAAGGRQRATEMMALQVAGVRRAILVRSLAIEAAILALTALFGVAAGAGTGAIALPSLPQLAAPTDTPLSYALPVWLILAVALGAVLVVMVATALAARGILTSMSPSLLRAEADDVD
jgi:putative ABC transport system permease protein